jgi:hypothetical protein
LLRPVSIPGTGRLANAQDPLGRQVERNESQQNGYRSERSGMGREHRKKMRGDGLTLEQDSILEYHSRQRRSATSFRLGRLGFLCPKGVAFKRSPQLGLFYFSG